MHAAVAASGRAPGRGGTLGLQNHVQGYRQTPDTFPGVGHSKVA